MAAHKKAKPAVAPFSHLPDEIVFDGILSKLPVKSLYRFRCVSKLWNAAISSDSHFFETQLSWAKHVSGSSIIGLYSLHFKQVNEEWLQFHMFAGIDRGNYIGFETKRLRQLVGECNGLFCLRSSSGFEICNPCTREFLYRPFPRKDSGPSKSYGFGFDPSKNEYKLVQVTHDNPNVYRCIVYTLGGSGKNPWNDITDASGLSDHLGRCTRPRRDKIEASTDEGRGLHINGKLYWFFHRAHTFLVFDVHNERFERLDGPEPKGSLEAEFRKPWKSRCFLTEWRGCVCLAYQNNGDTALHLYTYESHRHDWNSIKVPLVPTPEWQQRIGVLGGEALLIRIRGHQLEVFTSVGQNSLDSETAERFPLPPDVSLDEVATFHFMYRIENVASLKTFVESETRRFEHVEKWNCGKNKSYEVQVKSVSSL